LREREKRAMREFLSSEEVKESSKKTFQQIWAIAFIGTHSKGKIIHHEKGTKIKEEGQQILGTFFEAVRTTFNVVLLL